MVPHILLEEIGVPHRRVLVGRAVGAHQTPQFLRLNPDGRIPVLVDGDHVPYKNRSHRPAPVRRASSCRPGAVARQLGAGPLLPASAAAYRAARAR